MRACWRVTAGTLKLRSAATLMAVSYRQAKRLAARYRTSGALRHRSAGRASNHGVPRRRRTRVLALVRAKSSGGIDQRFDPTLAAEHLHSEDGLTVDHETLRWWISPRACGVAPEKRARIGGGASGRRHFGEVVQMDGSFHRWFEDRAPAQCLLTLVDDATGATWGQIGAHETIWAAVAVLRGWIADYGVAQALYTDWKNVYVRPPNAADRVTGAEPLTQFGRMCPTLGIQIIPASSPQAKGRIERNHGTRQDRLVKKLRRAGIADLTAANTFLETAYWADHNRRFAQPPAAADDFHVTAPPRPRLDYVFQLEERRVVSHDWVVRYHNRCLQLERQSRLPPARSTVQVREDATGHIDIRYRDHAMRWTELPAVRPASGLTPRPDAVVPPPPTPRGARPQPSVDHPWHQAVAAHRLAQQVAKERRAWQRVQP